MGNLIQGGFESGTYTPTIDDTTNIDSTVAEPCMYIRMGSIVHVSGLVQINPTSSGILTQVGITLPFSTDFGTSKDCTGVASAMGQADGAEIYGDTGNNWARLRCHPDGTGNDSWYFHIMYRIM